MDVKRYVLLAITIQTGFMDEAEGRTLLGLIPDSEYVLQAQASGCLESADQGLSCFEITASTNSETDIQSSVLFDRFTKALLCIPIAVQLNRTMIDYMKPEKTLILVIPR